MTQTYGFRVRWSEADGGYFADFSEIPILTGFGATPEDAIAELRDVLRAVIDAWRERTAVYGEDDTADRRGGPGAGGGDRGGRLHPADDEVAPPRPGNDALLDVQR
jgi:predicted RNase H-like HicB family nuclease